MSYLGDLIIICSLVATCFIFILVIFIVRRILLSSFDYNERKNDTICKYLTKHEENISETNFFAQKSNIVYICDHHNASRDLEVCECSSKREETRRDQDENVEILDEIADEKHKPVVTKAISCDSILSDMEVSNCESLKIGQLEFALYYNRETSELTVNIIQARDLEKETSGKVNSFVKVWLIPRNQGKFQTQIQNDSDCPRFMEKFVFNVPGCEFELQTLKFQVLSQSVKSSSKILGESELRLGDILGLLHPFKVWLNLHELNYEPPDCGDILFSMSYLPTAERLTLIVIKARNLKWPVELQVTENYVKVHVFQNSRRIQKKKTSNKKDEHNPTYNESMTFMVPATSLQSLQLRVTVTGHLQHGGQYQIGHVTVGSKVTGTELVHWNQTLNSLRRQTSMWHSLRR